MSHIRMTVFSGDEVYLQPMTPRSLGRNGSSLTFCISSRTVLNGLKERKVSVIQTTHNIQS